MGRDTLAQVLAPILRTLKPAVENVVHKALRAWQDGDSPNLARVLALYGELQRAYLGLTQAMTETR